MKRLNLTLFKAILIDEFGLVMPITVKFKKGVFLDGVDCFATWEYKHGRHRILVDSTASNQPHMFFAVLAHEMAHAWQLENGYYEFDEQGNGSIEDEHGEDSKFIDWKKYFEEKYNVDIVTMLPDGLTIEQLLEKA